MRRRIAAIGLSALALGASAAPALGAIAFNGSLTQQNSGTFVGQANVLTLGGVNYANVSTTQKAQTNQTAIAGCGIVIVGIC